MEPVPFAYECNHCYTGALLTLKGKHSTVLQSDLRLHCTCVSGLHQHSWVELLSEFSPYLDVSAGRAGITK